MHRETGLTSANAGTGTVVVPWRKMGKTTKGGGLHKFVFELSGTGIVTPALFT